MADTFTTSLKFRKQETGANDNTWGAFLNDFIDQLDAAVAGVLDKAVNGGSVTLSDDEFRYPVIRFSGVLGSNQTVNVSALRNRWFVRNGTTGAFTLTVKTAAGAGVAIPPGAWRLIYCDGTDVIEASITDYQAISSGEYIWCGDAAGSANAIDLTSPSTATAYITGQKFRFRATASNTDEAVVNVNGIGQKALVDQNGSALKPLAIRSGLIYEAMRDGVEDRLILLGVVGPAGVEVITENTALTGADRGKTILVDTSAGDVTVTLPALASAGNGFDLTVKKIHADNSAIVDGDGAETIDGATTLTLTDDDQAVGIVGDATGWHVTALMRAIASADDFRGNVATKVLDTTGVFAAAASVALTDAPTIDFDMDEGWNRHVTISADRELGAPSSVKPVSGRIEVTAVGDSRTLSIASGIVDPQDLFPVTILSGETAYVYYDVDAGGAMIVTAVLGV